MHVKKLLDFLKIDKHAQINWTTSDLLLSDLCETAADLTTNDVFIARQGQIYNGNAFIEAALTRGAACIISDQIQKLPTNFAVVPDLTSQIPSIANFFYDYPSHKLATIGVTGTNGKTTMVYMLQQILNTISSCGLISTIGIGYQELQHSDNTTPNACTLQKTLRNFINQQLEFCAMEVSSHAIHQKRIDGMRFALGIFTNLSIEHVDYHKTFANYWHTKASFFLNYPCENLLFNADCPYGRILAKRHPDAYIYSIHDRSDLKNRLIWLSQNKQNHSQYTICTPWGQYNIPKDHHATDFNTSNLLGALAGALIVTQGKINLSTLPPLSLPKGRMQIIDEAPLTIVDYAHTADALTLCLQNLRKLNPQKIYCVFGCGGERLQEKRSTMLDAACRLSDQVIITQDNPRGEDPELIIEHMLHNNMHHQNYKIILDRKQAIGSAIQAADQNDIVLIAGKGHEDYQIIGVKKIPCSDIDLAKHALQLRKHHVPQAS